MQHCRIPATEGVEFWISCKRPAFLSSFGLLQVIQNKHPWCWDVAYVTAGYTSKWSRGVPLLIFVRISNKCSVINQKTGRGTVLPIAVALSYLLNWCFSNKLSHFSTSWVYYPPILFFIFSLSSNMCRPIDRAIKYVQKSIVWLLTPRKLIEV